MAALQQPQGRPVDLAERPEPANTASAIAQGHHYILRETRASATQPPDGRLFFLAERQADGTYAVTLTDSGMQKLETALGIADDLGGQSRISPRSTIADIMERTATREELSQLLRRGGDTFAYRLRLGVLHRRLRASEAPSAQQKTISHIGKALIVAIVGVWALMQFVAAVQDIAAIPGILAGIPSDIFHLHPTSAFAEVGSKISDAGTRVLAGVLGSLLTYVVSRLIQPFAPVYRMDQLVPGERLALRVVNDVVRRLDEHQYTALTKRR